MKRYYFAFYANRETYLSSESEDCFDTLIKFAEFAKVTDEYAWGQFIEINPTYSSENSHIVKLVLPCPNYDHKKRDEENKAFAAKVAEYIGSTFADTDLDNVYVVLTNGNIYNPRHTESECFVSYDTLAKAESECGDKDSVMQLSVWAQLLNINR